MLSVFTTLLFFCCFRVSKTIKRRIIVEINGTAVSRAFNGLVGRNEKGDYFVFIDKLTLYFIFVSSCLHFLMFMIMLWLNIKAGAFEKNANGVFPALTPHWSDQNELLLP